MDSPTPSDQTASNQSNLGLLGEEVVAAWLRSRDWQILHQRWTCRFGELDLVAQLPKENSLIAFVEVKTRSQGNWDGDGLLAITPAKQAKLWKTAQLFLVKHPHLGDCPCRFDVAIVKCRSQSKPLIRKNSHQIAEHELILQSYIPDAFTQN